MAFHLIVEVFPFLKDSLRTEFIRSFRAHYDSIGYKESYPYDGVSSLLQDIIYSPLYTYPSIVTNKPTRPTVSLLYEFNLHHFFDHIIGIDYLLSSSNDRTFANKSDAIKYLVSITQPSCDYLYIGDTISDMESASLAGCDFLAVGYGYTNWEKSISSVGAPIIVEKNIFIVTENGYFVILNAETGEIISSTNILNILKKKNQSTKVTGFIMGSGKIYSVTLNGFLIISSASTGKVEEFKKLGDQVTANPIISDGKLFIYTDNSRILGFN